MVKHKWYVFVLKAFLGACKTYQGIKFLANMLSTNVEPQVNATFVISYRSILRVVLMYSPCLQPMMECYLLYDGCST